MSFASTYLKRYASGLKEDFNPPNPDLFFSIIIPVYNEPDLLFCLRSIFESENTGLPTEIILVFNSPDEGDACCIEVNDKVICQVKEVISAFAARDIHILILNPDPFPSSKAGPGLARKIGMDLAISRFNQINQAKGIIVSLDADTLVDRNYFVELQRFYLAEPKANTCTPYFEHLRVFAGKEIPNLEALLQYELYLRTVKLSLIWAGYPLAFHTLGSAFSVKASAYVRAGGMGVQRSGEDFYFLHKCAQLGEFWENNLMKVYPSGRASDRVLFGTGPFIRDYNKNYPEGYKKYSWKAFIDLKVIMKEIESLHYSLSESDIFSKMTGISDPILEELGWASKIAKAKGRAGDEKSFRKWIWREIDGLQVVRYLNGHQKISGADQVMLTAAKLLNSNGYTGCTLEPQIVMKEIKKLDRRIEVRKVY